MVQRTCVKHDTSRNYDDDIHVYWNNLVIFSVEIIEIKFVKTLRKSHNIQGGQWGEVAYTPSHIRGSL